MAKTLQVRVVVWFLTIFFVGTQAFADELTLHVSPTDRLLTEPASIIVGGAPPGAEVVIEATFNDRGG